MAKIQPQAPTRKEVVPVPKSATYGAILSGYTLPKPAKKYMSEEMEDKMGFRFYVSHTSTGKKIKEPTSVYLSSNLKFSPPGKYQASKLFTILEALLAAETSTEELIQTNGDVGDYNELVGKPIMLQIELKNGDDGKTYMNVKSVSACEDEVREAILEDVLPTAVFETDTKTDIKYLKSPKPTYVNGDDNDEEPEPVSKAKAAPKTAKPAVDAAWDGSELIQYGKHKADGNAYNSTEVDDGWLTWAVEKKTPPDENARKEIARRSANAASRGSVEAAGSFESEDEFSDDIPF